MLNFLAQIQRNKSKGQQQQIEDSAKPKTSHTLSGSKTCVFALLGRIYRTNILVGNLRTSVLNCGQCTYLEKSMLLLHHQPNKINTV